MQSLFLINHVLRYLAQQALLVNSIHVSLSDVLPKVMRGDITQVCMYSLVSLCVCSLVCMQEMSRFECNHHTQGPLRYFICKNTISALVVVIVLFGICAAESVLISFESLDMYVSLFCSRP